jgi:hypothetical protein
MPEPQTVPCWRCGGPMAPTGPLDHAPCPTCQMLLREVMALYPQRPALPAKEEA